MAKWGWQSFVGFSMASLVLLHSHKLSQFANTDKPTKKSMTISMCPVLVYCVLQNAHGITILSPSKITTSKSESSSLWLQYPLATHRNYPFSKLSFLPSHSFQFPFYFCHFLITYGRTLQYHVNPHVHGFMNPTIGISDGFC